MRNDSDKEIRIRDNGIAMLESGRVSGEVCALKFLQFLKAHAPQKEICAIIQIVTQHRVYLLLSADCLLISDV